VPLTARRAYIQWDCWRGRLGHRPDRPTPASRDSVAGCGDGGEGEHAAAPPAAPGGQHTGGSAGGM